VARGDKGSASRRGRNEAPGPAERPEAICLRLFDEQFPEAGLPKSEMRSRRQYSPAWHNQHLDNGAFHADAPSGGAFANEIPTRCTRPVLPSMPRSGLAARLRVQFRTRIRRMTRPWPTLSPRLKNSLPFSGTGIERAVGWRVHRRWGQWHQGR